jgi:hypothetical protein
MPLAAFFFKKKDLFSNVFSASAAWARQEQRAFRCVRLVVVPV